MPRDRFPKLPLKVYYFPLCLYLRRHVRRHCNFGCDYLGQQWRKPPKVGLHSAPVLSEVHLRYYPQVLSLETFHGSVPPQQFPAPFLERFLDPDDRLHNRVADEVMVDFCSPAGSWLVWRQRNQRNIRTLHGWCGCILHDLRFNRCALRLVLAKLL